MSVQDLAQLKKDAENYLAALRGEIHSDQEDAVYDAWQGTNKAEAILALLARLEQAERAIDYNANDIEDCAACDPELCVYHTGFGEGYKASAAALRTLRQASQRAISWAETIDVQLKGNEERLAEDGYQDGTPVLAYLKDSRVMVGNLLKELRDAS